MEFTSGFFAGLGLGITAMQIVFNVVFGDMCDSDDIKNAQLDVYRGKTTLEITYRDSVAVDSTVVYKMKDYEKI